MLYSHRCSLTNETTKPLTDLRCLLEIPPSGQPSYFGGGNLMKEIPLSKEGKNRGKFVALVDDSDHEMLSRYNWSLFMVKTNNYARAIIDGKGVLMHRLILGLTDPKILGDHADTNGLNNQRSNLRIATRTQNGVNRKACGTSKYLGVHLDKYKYWITQISINKKQTYLGYFKSEIEAAKAYDVAAKKHYGEFANLNFK